MIRIKYVYLLLVMSLFFIVGCQGETEKIIEEEYTNDKGLIHAYPANLNSDYLSESIGLYMQYLLMIEDKTTFHQQYEQLSNHFIINDNGNTLITWRLSEEASVNALIDDIRIARVLSEASKAFNKPIYLDLAKKIISSIEMLQVTDKTVVDFYDWSIHTPSDRITLSYLGGDYSFLITSKELLREIDDSMIFFPEYYDIKEDAFISNNEVHMIDQLLIAINRAAIEETSKGFNDWLIQEWDTNKEIHGRYDRKSHKATVKYESLAVYYYLHAYFTSIGEVKLAEEVFNHAKEIGTKNTLDEAHFFDYIHYQMLLEQG